MCFGTHLSLVSGLINEVALIRKSAQVTLFSISEGTQSLPVLLFTIILTVKSSAMLRWTSSALPGLMLFNKKTRQGSKS